MKKTAIGGLVTAALIAGTVLLGAVPAQAKADFSCVNSGASGKGWSYEIIRCPAG
ncbi:hypothetical protein [Streptomyces sp. AC495_CC817]|uniref:hypothetical protein n=1 Tax=Streptomyces sp. AC495_CC817 TaxID=2823900 RepID=UPI001C2734F4|nr:hypothetical protein [Streptomyces sp. AC495_CC817]